MGKSLRVGTKVWADKINGALRKAALDWTRACIEAGHLLLTAKRECAPGDFHDMLENELDVEPRTAQRCMKVAAHPVLGDTTNLSRLPAAFAALHELSRLPATDVLRLMEAGNLRPESRIQDVVALLPAASPKPRETTPFRAKGPILTIDVDHEEITESEPGDTITAGYRTSLPDPESADEADTPAEHTAATVPGSAVPAEGQGDEPEAVSASAADRHEGGDSDDRPDDSGEVSVFDNEPASPSAVAVERTGLDMTLDELEEYIIDDQRPEEWAKRTSYTADRLDNIIDWLDDMARDVRALEQAKLTEAAAAE